jgi:hypothetical protein
MKTYIVNISIHNALHVEAMTAAEAGRKVLDMDTLDIIHDADFEITYAKEEDEA